MKSFENEKKANDRCFIFKVFDFKNKQKSI